MKVLSIGGSMTLGCCLLLPTGSQWRHLRSCWLLLCELSVYWVPSLGIGKKKYKQSSLKQGPRGDLGSGARGTGGEGKQKIIKSFFEINYEQIWVVTQLIWWHLIIVFLRAYLFYPSWSIVALKLKTDSWQLPLCECTQLSLKPELTLTLTFRCSF